MNCELNNQYLTILFLLDLYAKGQPAENLNIALINGFFNNLRKQSNENGKIYFKKYMTLGFMIREGLVIKFIKGGQTPELISSKLDISTNTVYKICRKNGITIGRKKGFKDRFKMRLFEIDRELAREMHSDRVSFSDISNLLGLSEKWVQDLVRK
ncbi:MAG: hypothetical protein SNJ29_12220 [Rikenellaceae bacterium]